MLRCACQLGTNSGGNGTFELETKRLGNPEVFFPYYFMQGSANCNVAINVNCCSCMRFSGSTPCLRFASQSTPAALASERFLAVSPSKLSKLTTTNASSSTPNCFTRPIANTFCRSMKPSLITLVNPVTSVVQSIVNLQNKRQINPDFTKCWGKLQMPGRHAYRTEKAVGMQVGRLNKNPKLLCTQWSCSSSSSPLRQMDRCAALTEPSVG